MARHRPWLYQAHARPATDRTYDVFNAQWNVHDGSIRMSQHTAAMHIAKTYVYATDPRDPETRIIGWVDVLLTALAGYLVVPGYGLTAAPGHLDPGEVDFMLESIANASRRAADRLVIAALSTYALGGDVAFRELARALHVTSPEDLKRAWEMNDAVQEAAYEADVLAV